VQNALLYFDASCDIPLPPQCTFVCICVPFATNTFGHSSGGLPVHPRTCQLVRNNTASSLVVNEGAKTARLLEVQRWWKIRASRVQKSVANYEATCVIL
jgi:hypothetical protein